MPLDQRGPQETHFKMSNTWCVESGNTFGEGHLCPHPVCIILL